MRPLLLIALLCGCATDDLERPGTWRPSGANDANLRAMIAEPSHLRSGVAARTERAEPATQAIQRLQTDRRRPLPDSRAAQIGVNPAGIPSAVPSAAGGGANAP